MYGCMNERERTIPGPSVDDAYENQAAGDDAMADDLTEERDATPEQRSDVADSETLDP